MPYLSEAEAVRHKIHLVNEKTILATEKEAHGFFKNFIFTSLPYSGDNISFKTIEGKEYKLSDFKGKTLLVNFWAWWCAPCRQEMPELAHLQRVLGGDKFQVITINLGTNPHSKLEQFMKAANADNFVLYRDPSMKSFDELRNHGLAVGLPVTLLFDKDTHLIGSYNGIAPWSNEDAQRLIRAAIDADHSGGNSVVEVSNAPQETIKAP